MVTETLDINETESYFKENAEFWIKDAYQTAGYNYPVGIHRVRIIKKVMQQLTNVKNIIDIGCGGGHLPFELVKEGYQVLGIDQSKPMIDYANKNKAHLQEDEKKRVNFLLSSIDDVESGSFDAMTAMGLIGYLPNDEHLFLSADRLLSEKGYAIISFRNRLFNLFSISPRTIKESESGSLKELVDEFSSAYYKKIDKTDSKKWIENLHLLTKKILEEGLLDKIEEEEVNEKMYSFNIEARQSTPQQVMKTAEKCGYNILKLYGVHPHLTIPGLNHMLSSGLYNLLSDSLIPFEASPISLLWSSVFIGVFQKS